MLSNHNCTRTDPKHASVPAPSQSRPLTATNRFAVAAQEQALQNAMGAGPAALLAYAQQLNARYQQRAAEQQAGYRLLFMPGYRFAQGVEKIADRTPYLQEQNADGEETCMCGQQGYIERVNRALAGAGLTYRVYDKHRWILFLLERSQSLVGCYDSLIQEGALPA